MTIRDVTERPEAVVCGSGIIAGVNSQEILKSIKVVVEELCAWKVLEEHLRENVSPAVVRIFLGKD